MDLAIIGTDTGIGKTHVTLGLATALRQRQRRVWLHKPVACGDWDGTSADDGRRLRAACGDAQDPATVCPFEFAEPASPHLAAAAAGVQLRLEDLDAGIAAVRGDHDLLVEGAGGLLAPLTQGRHTFAELLPRWQLPAILVTRPDLGTLNHTTLTVRVARSAGISLRAIIINRARPVAEDSLAVRSAPAELRLLTGLPVVESLAALVNVLLAPTFTP